MKKNLMSDFQQCTTLKNGRNNVTQRRNNVAQRWNNVDTTLFYPSVDVSQSYIESSRASDYYEFANR